MKDEYGEIVELIMPIYKDSVTTFHLEASSGELIRCKDCKYYESVDGVFPVCNKWAKGCQTEPDGYCFLGEITVKE